MCVCGVLWVCVCVCVSGGWWCVCVGVCVSVCGGLAIGFVDRMGDRVAWGGRSSAEDID